MRNPAEVRPNRSLPGYQLLLPLWEMACRAALARYRRRLADGAAVNAATLRGILRRNAASEFGRRHDFAGLARSADVEAAYAGALPVADYADFREPFARMAAGARDVMFPGRPRLFVSTSGTTGDPKLFPVTARQQNAALAFIALLTPAARAACNPGLGFRQPTATLMVASRPGRQTVGGIPVGNPSGAGIRRILKLAPPFWVFPAEVLTVQDHPTALYLHALFALRAADLGCIEAIYCSHIVSWMGLIERRRAELVGDIANGGLAGNLVLTSEERATLSALLPPAPERARQVARELDGDPAGRMTRLWPRLKVLSAVVSGAFAVSVPRLRELAGPGPALYTTCFGATEGMVGINLWGDAPERYALALGAVHFEFLPVGELDAGRPRTVGIGALDKGERYEIVITSHAGLYRYRLGDVVRIVDFAGSTPVFEFDHRRGSVVDLVGEKTTEQHFRSAFARLAREELGGEAGLADFTIWPDIGSLPYRYVAYAEAAPAAPRPDGARLAARLDVLLAMENPSYATLGRLNGRLDPVDLRLVRPGTFEQLVNLQRDNVAGVNANQVKVPRLLRNPEQRALLQRGVLATAGG
ncbi:MAG: GH3 auxin-responsive promoter family protein [Chromatiales bacterium]|nr:GH3 auxin-responsive promoter family protein [Chromatiales bacterium]